MATGKSALRSPPAQRTSASDVEAFLAVLDHPRKAEILLLRQIILDADPAIAEGIKWNAPSFRSVEYFATFHLRAAKGVQLILHLGAKKRALPASGMAVADPHRLLEWLAADRSTITLADVDEIESKREILNDLIREWLRHV